ncbi:MAG: FHA domain-containing protein, partial [Myxococcota bacterium]
DTFYTPHTEPGGVYTDEIITGFLSSLGYEQHIGGLIDHTEFIDDRWVNGEAKRHVTVLTPPRVPEGHRKEMVGRPISEVLDGPSTFQVGASEALVLLRRYLEKIEEMDLAKGIEPRVRMFTSHRVVTGTTSGSPDETSYVEWMTQDDGFVKQNDGRMQIRIEAIRELDYRGRFRRIRVPGTEVIDLGVPELFMIAQGFYSSDAERLGFEQEDIEVDHHDGRGPVVAQADYLAGLFEIHVGARLRRRIASEFDSEGNEYWVRQLAVGHEDDPEVGWILVQVPDFKTFDPVLAGLVPEGTDPNSKLYSGAYHHMLRDFYLEQVSLVTEIPRDKLEELQMPYGPKMFSLVERMGADSKVTENGIVAGDSFGNGHFLTSGGAITGMVGHACRVLEYWQAREAGASASDALRKLADAVRDDTEGWMHVSAQEFSRSAPINFGDERIAEIAKSSGRTGEDRAKTIDATRRHRHGLVPLNPSDWRRLLIRA